MQKVMDYFKSRMLCENLFYAGALMMNIGMFLALPWPWGLIFAGATVVIISLLNHPDWMEVEG